MQSIHSVILHCGVSSGGVPISIDGGGRSEQTVTRMSKPGESTNTLFWITVIYPFLIIILGFACQSIMSNVIRSLPLAESGSLGPRDDSPTSEKANLSLDDDLNSNSPAKKALTEPINAFESPHKSTEASSSKLLSSSIEGPLQAPIKKPGQRASDSHKLQILQASILHALVMLMAHRLGIIAVRRVQETQDFREKIIGLVAIFAAAFLALLSGGKLELGRALSAQGYRNSNGDRPAVDQSDPLVMFIIFSFFSLSVPLVRLLIA